VAGSDDLLDEIAQITTKLILRSSRFSDPDVLAIVKSASARGLWVSCVFLADAPADAHDFDVLARAGVRTVTVPLDGAWATAHDARHGHEGSWSRMLQIFTAARRARISVRVKTTFDREMLAECWRIAQVVRNLQPEIWEVGLAFADGREMPDPVQTETLLRALVAHSTHAGTRVAVPDNPQFRRVVMQSRADFWKRLPASHTRNTVFISARGEIQPGENLPIACGNVRTHRLADVHAESTVFRRLRSPDRLEGKCGRCEFRALCGGSRARAFAVTGNYLAADPACPYEPASTRAAVRTLFRTA
jgi:radical SAM protein with 4Fe4S-binding SPASM domain